MEDGKIERELFQGGARPPPPAPPQGNHKYTFEVCERLCVCAACIDRTGHRPRHAARINNEED